MNLAGKTEREREGLKNKEAILVLIVGEGKG